MIIFSERRDFDVEQLARLYEHAPWAFGRAAADIREMLANTDLALSAWDEGRLVGFGRQSANRVQSGSSTNP